jgi:hypothetical protein
MNVVSNAKGISENDQALIELLSRDDATDSLESLFTPLQSNDPVEQFVRRT